jgi:hypothetical protein
MIRGTVKNQENHSKDSQYPIRVLKPVPPKYETTEAPRPHCWVRMHNINLFHIDELEHKLN